MRCRRPRRVHRVESGQRLESIAKRLQRERRCDLRSEPIAQDGHAEARPNARDTAIRHARRRQARGPQRSARQAERAPRLRGALTYTARWRGQVTDSKGRVLGAAITGISRLLGVTGTSSTPRSAPDSLARRGERSVRRPPDPHRQRVSHELVLRRLAPPLEPCGRFQHPRRLERERARLPATIRARGGRVLSELVVRPPRRAGNRRLLGRLRRTGPKHLGRSRAYGPRWPKPTPTNTITIRRSSRSEAGPAQNGNPATRLVGPPRKRRKSLRRATWRPRRPSRLPSRARLQCSETRGRRHWEGRLPTDATRALSSIARPSRGWRRRAFSRDPPASAPSRPTDEIAGELWSPGCWYG